jgi:hypothetical protein
MWLPIAEILGKGYTEATCSFGSWRTCYAY